LVDNWLITWWITFNKFANSGICSELCDARSLLALSR
jgi:hypothetical protein